MVSKTLTEAKRAATIASPAPVDATTTVQFTPPRYAEITVIYVVKGKEEVRNPGLAFVRRIDAWDDHGTMQACVFSSSRMTRLSPSP